MDRIKLEALINRGYSYSKICAEMKVSRCKLTAWLKKFGLKTQHTFKTKSWNKIKKICPICSKNFSTLEGHDREKTTCSYSCSNKFFRVGRGNGNFKEADQAKSANASYRRICFSRYPKKCLLCDWNKIVEVHHLDGNSKNNSIDNLVPLCPNHHRLTIMSKYKEEIDKEIRSKLTGNTSTWQTPCSGNTK